MLTYTSDEDGSIKFEITVYENYLPTQLGAQELSDIIMDIITFNNLSISKDMGRVMKELASKYAGRYDGKLASEIVRVYKNN